MNAVSDNLLETILQLQRLPSFIFKQPGCGTNFAIRYGHHIAYHIDLFFPGIIGKPGYELIKDEIMAFYGDDVFAIDYPCDEDNQFLFHRFLSVKAKQVSDIK